MPRVQSKISTTLKSSGVQHPTPLTKFTAANAFVFAPTWSSDGSKLAFVSSRALDGSNGANPNGTDNIWIMNADGSTRYGPNQTYSPQCASENPQWQP